MLSSQQLGWVVRNRRRPSRVERLGVVAEDVVHRAERMSATVDGEIAGAIGELVDAEFLAGCRVGSLDKGVLTVFVRDASLVYSYRVRWAMDIVEGLRTRCPERWIRQVKFLKDVSPEDASSQWRRQTDSAE